jgi:hypothetical protein
MLTHKPKKPQYETILGHKPQLSGKTRTKVIQAHIINATPGSEKRSLMWDKILWIIMYVLLIIIVVLIATYHK